MDSPCPSPDSPNPPRRPVGPPRPDVGPCKEGEPPARGTGWLRRGRVDLEGPSAGTGRPRLTPPTRRPSGRPIGHVHGSPAVSGGQKCLASNIFEKRTKNDFFGKINPGCNICTPLSHSYRVGGYMKGGEWSPLGDDSWVFALDGCLQADVATSLSGLSGPIPYKLVSEEHCVPWPRDHRPRVNRGTALCAADISPGGGPMPKGGAEPVHSVRHAQRQLKTRRLWPAGSDGVCG